MRDPHRRTSRKSNNGEPVSRSLRGSQSRQAVPDDDHIRGRYPLEQPHEHHVRAVILPESRSWNILTQCRPASLQLGLWRDVSHATSAVVAKKGPTPLGPRVVRITGATSPQSRASGPTHGNGRLPDLAQRMAISPAQKNRKRPKGGSDRSGGIPQHWADNASIAEVPASMRHSRSITPDDRHPERIDALPERRGRHERWISSIGANAISF